MLITLLVLAAADAIYAPPSDTISNPTSHAPEESGRDLGLANQCARATSLENAAPIDDKYLETQAHFFKYVDSSSGGETVKEQRS